MPTRDSNNIENPSGLELPYQGKTLSLRHLNKTTEALQAMTRGARAPNQLTPDFDPHLHNTLRLVCVNNTGHEYEVGEAIGLLDLDTDEPKDIVNQQVAVGRIPQKDDRGKFFVVVHEGGEKNAVLKVACEGIQRAKIYVGDAQGAGMLKKWKFADIDHKSTGNKWNLSLMPYGSARVLWMDGNGGAYRDCLIKFQNHSFAADLEPYQVPEDGDTWTKWRHLMPDQSRLGVEANLRFSDGKDRRLRFDAKGHLVRVCLANSECPTPTPTPSATATPTTEIIQTPTPTPQDSGTPTPTPSPTDCSVAVYCDSPTLNVSLSATCSCSGDSFPASFMLSTDWNQGSPYHSLAMTACVMNCPPPASSTPWYSWTAAGRFNNGCDTDGPDCVPGNFPLLLAYLYPNAGTWNLDLVRYTACGTGSTCGTGSGGVDTCDPTGAYTMSCGGTATITWG